MSTVQLEQQQDQELFQNPETDALSLEENVKSSSEVISPAPSDRSEKPIEKPKSPSEPTTPHSSKKDKPVKKTVKPPTVKRESIYGRKPGSGIPLRVKADATNSGSPQSPPANALKQPKKTTTYRAPPQPPSNLPVINKTTLEIQFKNNKKRLIQMHAELMTKQQPLLDMYKSLQRTKKQLDEMGKKVTLDDLKFTTLKLNEDKDDDLEKGAGEQPVAEVTLEFKNSVSSILESLTQVCERCIAKRDDMLTTFENLCMSDAESNDMMAEIQTLKKEKNELQKALQTTVQENEKKLAEIVRNWQIYMNKGISKETADKIQDLEEKVKQQQKLIKDAEENNVHLNRKFEDNRISYERSLNEFQEKVTKLEEELKKEKKQANDNLMKTRNMRTKVTDLETRYKDAEEKKSEALAKIRQIQDQMKKSESMWNREKDDLKKAEAALQQKFIEKQSHLDTRLKTLEQTKKIDQEQQDEAVKSLEGQLETKDREIEALVNEKNLLNDQIVELEAKAKSLEEEIRRVSERCSEKAGDHAENKSEEIKKYKSKIDDLQKTLGQQSEQITKMNSSLKAHAQLAVALKVEKDNALKYCKKLRDMLREARDDIDVKNKTIYKIHEKLVSKETDCDRLRCALKDLETNYEMSNQKPQREEFSRCQLCMAPISGENNDCSGCFETMSLGASNVSKNTSMRPHYVSESLIGMSVKKVDHIRAKIDNLKKMKLPHPPTKRRYLSKMGGWTNQCQQAKTFNHLKKQIEMRGKLYEILQKHADQSCEDFINLLKLTVSSCSEKTMNELKPSNVACGAAPTRAQKGPNWDGASRYSSSNMNVSQSYHSVSHYNETRSFDQIYDEVEESYFLDRNSADIVM